MLKNRLDFLALYIAVAGRRAGGKRLQSKASEGHAGTRQDCQRQDWTCEQGRGGVLVGVGRLATIRAGKSEELG